MANGGSMAGGGLDGVGECWLFLKLHLFSGDIFNFSEF